MMPLGATAERLFVCPFEFGSLGFVWARPGAIWFVYIIIPFELGAGGNKYIRR
jgi:hypothetical protein